MVTQPCAATVLMVRDSPFTHSLLPDRKSAIHWQMETCRIDLVSFYGVERIATNVPGV